MYDYDKVVTNTISIDKENFQELIELIEKKDFLNSEKITVDDKCMDAGTNYIKISLDNETIEFKNSCMENENFATIENKIFEIIGQNNINDFINKVKNYYDK